MTRILREGSATARRPATTQPLVPPVHIGCIGSNGTMSCTVNASMWRNEPTSSNNDIEGMVRHGVEMEDKKCRRGGELSCEATAYVANTASQAPSKALYPLPTCGQWIRAVRPVPQEIA